MAGNRHPVERPGAGEVGLLAKGSSSPRWDASGGHSSASALTISSEEALNQRCPHKSHDYLACGDCESNVYCHLSQF